jgi:acyl-CoA oxidase
LHFILINNQAMTIAHHKLSSGVLSLLPLFYIGWSDSVLSPSEMAFIHKKIKELGFLNPVEKDYLIKYTDPRNPPSDAVFKEWLDILRYEAAKLPQGSKQTLAQLGLDIAKAHTTTLSEMYDEPEVVQALMDIEKELGVYTDEDLNSMIFQLGISHIIAEPKTASFDTAKMLNILDGKRAATKRKVRQLLKDPFFQVGIERDKDQHRLKILDMTKALAQQGYGGLAYPKQYGGSGDMGEYMAIFETLAYHDLSLTIKFGVQFGLFGGAIYNLGTDTHHRKYLELTGKTEILGCFAMTETGHGSNVKDLETTLTYDHASQTLTIHTPQYKAGKEYIGNALHGSMAVVFGQLIVGETHHGIHAVVVPYRDKKGALLRGVTVKDCGYKMGLNGVDNGRLWFDNVLVPKENLLNKYGDIDENGNYTSPIENPNKRFFTMLGALVGGRICVGMAGNNAAKTALTIALKYALKRRQFAPKDGEPETILMDYPTHQHRLIPLLVKSYCYHFALYTLADQYCVANEEEMRKIETKAAGLKSLATWHGTNTVQTCREACGGKGFLSENRFADIKADSDIFTTFEGDNTVLMQLVAKGLLTEFKQSFHDEGVKAVMRYLGSKIGNVIAEYNPYFTRNTDIEHLLSAEFHAEALKYREKKILISLSERMKDFLKKRLAPHDAFLKCQMHMISLAKAYVERLVYREMIKKLAIVEDSAEKDMLKKLTTFYALHTIYEDKGWFLEADYMDGSKTKAIRRTLNKLIQELRPEVGALVGSFGIPDETLNADILK